MKPCLYTFTRERLSEYNRKGERKKLGLSNIGTAAIVLSVAFLLAAILLPIGMGEIYAANTTDWETSVVTIFQILFPILAVIGLALRFVPRFRAAGQ